jgi:hypothetical protein
MTQSLLSSFGGAGFGVELSGPGGGIKGILGSAALATSLLMLATDQNVRYVDKGGNDATGNGSRVAPFLTIQAAISNCSGLATAANPFVIAVSPGIYSETFLLAPFVYVHGLDQNATILNPATANWVGAAFAAGTVDTGISNLTLRSAFTIDFAAVGAAGTPTAQLRHLTMGPGSSIVLTGNTATSFFRLNDITSMAPVTTLTMNNCSSDQDGIMLRNGNVAFNGSEAYFTVHRLGSFSTYGSFAVTSTGVTNPLIVAIGNPGLLANATVVGAQAQLTANKYRTNLTMADANTTFSFGNTPNAAGATILACAGDHYISATPTAVRTITLERGDGGAAVPTSLIIKNNGNFNLLLAFSAGASRSASSQTYIPPGRTVRIYSIGPVWQVDGYIQSGRVALVNGVSPAIPADITPNTNIVASLLTFSGAAGVPQITGKVNGTLQAATGSFTITSINQGTGATIATDQGTYEWHAAGF